ncbi:MAG: bacteriohemerythrin [Desulfobacteraceae bacterium]|nr:bacteriohemerythrin [Desulfobacteraceae bacterium]
MGEDWADDSVRPAGQSDYICWLPEYSVGVERIDAQHRRIFAMINTLYTALGQPQTALPVRRVLEEMADYVSFHFDTERSYLGAMPGYAAHDQEHRQFIAKAANFTKDYQKLPPDRLLRDMLIFLAYWLKDHIKGTDKRQFARYLELLDDHRQPTNHKEKHG